MVAELLCTVRVMHRPVSTPSSGSARTRSIQLRKSSPSASGASAVPMTAMPSNSSPKPVSAWAAALPFLLRQKKPSITPANSTAQRASSSRKASSCAVTVVPMLAPNSTGTARRRGISPALTSPISITVTAELLCSTAVTASPVSTLRTGPPVSAARRVRIRSPAAASSPRLSSSIPYRNSASPPNKVRMLFRFSPMRPPPLYYNSI